MQDVWLVARRELRMHVLRRMFYIMTFGMPLLIGGLYLVVGWVSKEAGIEEVQQSLLAPPKLPSGLVDQSGVIMTVPPSFAPLFTRFPDEASAQAALDRGTVAAFFVVPANYRATGEVARVGKQVSFLSVTGLDTRALQALLRTNLVGDQALALLIDRPAVFENEIVGSQVAQTQGKAEGVVTGVSTGFAVLLAFSLLSGGNLLLSSISEEKSSRTLEVLLTSLRPWQLLSGKMLGLGLVALLQLTIWLTLGKTLLSTAQAALPTSSLGQVASTGIPPGMWGWALVFFVLGYLLYGSLMATLAGLGTSARESGQIASILTLPVLMPAWFLVSITERPEGALSLFLTLFPLTAPTTLMIRLGMGTVPAWQVALALVILAVSIVGALALAARLFRASTLLTGVRLTPRTLVRALRGA